MLEGPAGIGKTTQWRAALDLARTRGFRVLSSRQAEAERGDAFAGLGDLLDAEGVELGSLPASAAARPDGASKVKKQISSSGTWSD